MKKRGLARGKFRMDSGRKWNIKMQENKPNALEARERMMQNTPKSLTDHIVSDFMGGKNAAENQAKAYQEVIDNFKNGKGARESQGSLAAAARSRMIERHEQNSQRAEKYPDIGRDKANRRAYPAGGGRNV